MGYIELKTGQVALRPKSGVTPVRPDWKTVILPESRSWRGIAYGAGKFILADRNVGLYSADGINWTKTTLPSDISDIAYGNNRFVVVGSAKTSYSTDGLTWNTTEQSKSYTWVSFANDRFFASNDYSSTSIDYSTDGITWTSVTIGSVKALWRSVIYGNGTYVACSSDNNAWYSNDGINWTRGGSVGQTSYNNKDSYAFGNNTFVAIDGGQWDWEAPYMYYSTDGIRWTSKNLGFHIEAVSYGDGKFAIVGEKGAYSTDGINWTETTLPTFTDGETRWRMLTYGNGKFIAVAVKIGYSTDRIIYWNKKSTNEYTLVWEGAERTGTQWQYNELPDGNYYLSWLWRITPSVPFDTADTLALNTDKITNDTPLYTVVQPSDYLNLGDTALSKIFATVTKVWRHVTTTPGSAGGAANVTTWEVWLFNDGNFGLFGYQESEGGTSQAYPVWIEKLWKNKE